MEVSAPTATTLRQHLIDPELCTRCNTCQETCPSGAISNDGRNYVIEASKCNACLDCIQPCPTGAINNWRVVARDAVHSLEAQFSWDALPPETELNVASDAEGSGTAARTARDGSIQVVEQLYGRAQPALGRVVQNTRVTADGAEADIRHITLDLSAQHFPVLEGQSIGILPQGFDGEGRPHAMRVYSLASPRDGEGGRTGHVALTVKRVPNGVGSNYVCNLALDAQIPVVGPFGIDFLMPSDDETPLVMICTGTGVAPMRAMMLRRLQNPHARGRLHLFYGSRQPGETAYVDELGALAAVHPGQIHLHWAHSRQPGQPKRYVQDALREQGEVIAQLLADGRSVFYMCGLKGMEQGVYESLEAICAEHALNWADLKPLLIAHHRLHVETY